MKKTQSNAEKETEYCLNVFYERPVALFRSLFLLLLQVNQFSQLPVPFHFNTLGGSKML